MIDSILTDPDRYSAELIEWWVIFIRGEILNENFHLKTLIIIKKNLWQIIWYQNFNW